MAQGSHIPKFGNWDNDNVPYTAYFESARSEKVGAGKFNPNDPQDNPEAFMFDRFGDEHQNPSHPVPAPVNSSAAKPNMQAKMQHRRKTSDQQKSFDRRSMFSESISDISYGDYSSLESNQQHRRRNRTESSNRLPPPSPGHAPRSRSNPSDDLSNTSASVPKFGEWDERDPRSGEGFTVIFNKVKEEKHIAAAKFPSVHLKNSSHINNHKKDKRSKICCCLF